jgi:hypothetical protein
MPKSEKRGDVVAFDLLDDFSDRDNRVGERGDFDRNSNMHKILRIELRIERKELYTISLDD